MHIAEERSPWRTTNRVEIINKTKQGWRVRWLSGNRKGQVANITESCWNVRELTEREKELIQG